MSRCPQIFGHIVYPSKCLLYQVKGKDLLVESVKKWILRRRSVVKEAIWRVSPHLWVKYKRGKFTHLMVEFISLIHAGLIYLVTGVSWEEAWSSAFFVCHTETFTAWCGRNSHGCGWWWRRSELLSPLKCSVSDLSNAEKASPSGFRIPFNLTLLPYMFSSDLGSCDFTQNMHNLLMHCIENATASSVQDADEAFVWEFVCSHSIWSKDGDEALLFWHMAACLGHIDRQLVSC